MANPNRSGSLTAELLSSHKIKYSSATNHTFLAKAGNGSLPDAAVCKWLVQDKYYQLGYVNFIGGLLAKQDLSPCVFSSRSSEPQIKGKTLSRMTLDLLVDSVTAIRQEIDFYDETAKKYKLDLQYAPPNDTTNEYIKLFTDASAKDAPLLHGLLVLWATEHCYSRAWEYALSKADEKVDSQTNDTGAVAALYKAFIPNWTSEEFSGFVEKLTELTDTWAAESGDKERDECERLWVRVLELEENFWPAV